MQKKLLIAVLLSCMCGGLAVAQEAVTEDNSTPAGFIKKMVEPKEGEEFVNHTVMLGETIMLISKKYKVKPQDIYEYNPEAAQGVGTSAVLQIPMHRKFKSKKVKAAETAEAEAVANNH
jgi:LysM repeat protein